MTTLISVGVATALTQSVVYALPANASFVLANAALEVSLDNSNWVALTGANTTGVVTAAPFVRATTTGTIVICKPYR